MERFDSGTFDNWDSILYLWVREARGDRRRSKSDFTVQLLSHSVGSAYLLFCFRVVQCNSFSDNEPRDECTYNLGLYGILDMGTESNLMDRYRASANRNFTIEDRNLTIEDARPLIFQKVVFCARQWCWFVG